MSGPRSPQSTNITVGQSGSQSDFSKTSGDETDNRVTYRKRKQRECCDILTAINKLRDEMIASLETNLKPVRDDISSMKDQVNEIKNSTAKMLAEHNNMKAEISDLKQNNLAAELKISKLETQINELKSIPPKSDSLQNCDFANEKVINELQERTTRSKNVIIAGLPEPTIPDNAARQAEDMSSAQNILQNASTEQVKIIKAIRLGKYTTEKNRPLKICFRSPEEAKKILRNKNKLPDNIKVYSDQTPTQKAIMKELSQELIRRKENGEENLIIKYIKGTPKIVQTQPKNECH